jgi:Glycosyl transferase family 2
VNRPADPPRQRISACLIVQDEQEHLPGALESLRFADEIVVVDGGSTDGTVELARAAGARVIENPWPGFAAQRNLAVDAATGEWVFELDADERISPRLRASVLALLADPPEGVSIAVCPLRNRFLGRRLGASAKYPAYRSRLFRQGVYRHDESREVHEGIEPRERPAVLDGDLEHELATTLREALRDTWRYACLESAHIRRPHNPGAYLKGIVLRPAAKVAYRTIVDSGWQDGWQGMLKVLLDAASDALVWARVLLRGADGGSPGAAQLEDNDASRQHFGRRPTGPPKVVALAGGGNATLTAASWLRALDAEGLDVVLVSDQPGGGEGVPTRRVTQLWPLTTMRALDIELQLRTAHAVVPVGRRAKLIRHLLPGSLRPEIQGLDASLDPARAAQLARAAVDGR